MIIPQPPSFEPTRPWWKRWWGIVYLTLFCIVMAWVLSAVMMPTTNENERLVKGLHLQVGGVWLGLLLEIAIFVGAFRRRYWRFPTSRVLDGLVGVSLFVVCTFATLNFLG